MGRREAKRTMALYVEDGGKKERVRRRMLKKRWKKGEVVKKEKMGRRS